MPPKNSKRFLVGL
uniref:Uncharacterized protein n=1 Tax=Rhizophora mucronata TaxID=61149 RepID=A0A2P2IZ99_RHIMU